MNTSLRFLKYKLHQRPLFYEDFITALSIQPVLVYIQKVYDHGHNVLRLPDVYQIFFSHQVKESAIISNRHNINELPHELLNDLRLRILRN